MRSRALRAALLGALLVAAPAPVGGDPAAPPTRDPDLEAVMRGMATTSGVVARFREVKQLALLSEPLETRGTLYFVPPDRLSRITDAPSASRLVIDGERVAWRDAGGDDALDLSESPVARQYVANFMVLFNGDLADLRRRYRTEFETGDDGAWTLALRPRRRPLRDVVERVELRGEGRALTRMELVETGGDRTTTIFEEVRSDHAFSDAELERLFAEPAAPAESPEPPETR